jgi:hypothetical protein
MGCLCLMACAHSALWCCDAYRIRYDIEDDPCRSINRRIGQAMRDTQEQRLNAVKDGTISVGVCSARPTNNLRAKEHGCTVLPTLTSGPATPRYTPFRADLECHSATQFPASQLRMRACEITTNNSVGRSTAIVPVERNRGDIVPCPNVRQPSVPLRQLLEWKNILIDVVISYMLVYQEPQIVGSAVSSLTASLRAPSFQNPGLRMSIILRSAKEQGMFS